LPAPAKAGEFGLRQVPEINGAIVVMDPHTGRVLAMSGGFSYASSQFDRAMQAQRQPGSSFKPFVYATALDNGYTPVSKVLDSPFELDQGPGLGHLAAGKFRAGRISGRYHLAPGPGTVAQPDDRASGERAGHERSGENADPLRRLRQAADLAGQFAGLL
jgi:penicillin-binding protein 1A